MYIKVLWLMKVLKEFGSEMYLLSGFVVVDQELWVVICWFAL